ncbi:unnamed protein product [Rotaria socialis]|uniref:Uncharacterized protein n=1 Tax=Rotaria socialis TaxID=392032 RepID=A0A818BXC5_9BILA|nr:unnamed protein product [Rotaria socialis]CAF3547269.1 unnamed protein product [Rotaria socialis]CAF3598666.1 unnamed protein product [Rotaria socialis]CAF4349614.1 unnamed protein product [Rotaria socialis]CAF4473523.1 unnamed protein product [Rotaria socialis]
MSQANNRGGGNKRSRISSSGAYRQRENQSSSTSTNVAQTQSGLLIDNETELSSEIIKEQLNSVDDIITQPIIEVPTKRLLHLKELGGNLFVSSSTKIYSKVLQKLFDRVLFTKSLNNDVNTAPSDLRVFERVLARSDDNDAYSTCTSLVQPMSATILVLGSTSCEHAFAWKLSQRRNFKTLISPGNSGSTTDQPNGTISTIFQTEKDILDFVDAKQIDLVISLNKTFYFEELEARLCERGLHYLGCSVDTLALSDNQLNAKQFMTKHKIPTLEWTHCLNEQDAENYLNKHPNQHQWIVRATTGNGLINCRNREEALQTVKAVFEDHILGKLNQSIILEHGYSLDDNQICVLYIVSDGDGDYSQLPIIQSDPLRMGAYGPCPYVTAKQLSYIRRRIVERTLRCSPTIRHLFGFRLLLQGPNFNQVCLLDYLSTFEEPEAEILLSLCEPDVFLQYALDLPSVPILSLTSKKRRVHCVNTTISSTKNSLTIPNKILLTATKNNKVKIFHNQIDVNVNNNGSGETTVLTTSGERIFNVLGYGSTLQEAQIQSVLASEYIKQHANIDELLFKSDIGADAIEWYKTHADRHHLSTSSLTNGKKKKKPITTVGHKGNRGFTARRRNTKDAEQGDENKQMETSDDDENEPMDFERAFGSVSDVPKLEHMDIHQNNGDFNDFNIREGEFYFDLPAKIDLKMYQQPVLISSTINLNPLAALFNLNDGDMNDSQTVFEYLGHELTVRCANDLICARTLYVQCCSLPASSRRSMQRFYQGIEQACQQLDCTLLKTTTTTSSSLFSSLCTGLCDRDLIILNNTNHPVINENDLLIALRCSSSTVNTQGYIQLKDLFQKKNIHLNDTVPFRTVDGEEESFFSLLLQKSAILALSLSKTIDELIKNRTIKAIRYVKDIGLARMIESFLGSLSSTLNVELNGQQWPVMPPLFTWIYQHSGFSQDEMFEYFNCGVDYLLLVDHTKTSVDDILRQLTETHTSSYYLGTFISTNTSPVRKPIRLPQQPIVTSPRPRTIQLKNISFKYPKPYQAAAALTSITLPMVIKDRMKQPIANDKTRCAVLISTNDTSLLSLLAYSTSTLECAFEIVLVLSTLASLSDIARVNELYPSVVTKVIQPKKYAARHYDLDQKVDDELQLHGCELVILDRYACRLSPTFIMTWRGRLLSIYSSLLPAFRHSSSPIRDALQAGVRITGVTVQFIGESDTDNDGPIIAQESISVSPIETENQLESRLRILEQQLYPKAIDMVASGKIVYQGKRRMGKTNSITPTIPSSY